MQRNKIITIANHKGGVAKSQTAVELSLYLAQLGRKVLVVDTDPQGNATDIFLAGHESTSRTIAEILTMDRPSIREEDIQTRRLGGVSIDFLCSSIDSSRLEPRIKASPKEYIFSDAIKSVADKYDNIVVDTPPSPELLGFCALVATDCVIIPVTPDRPSIDGVESIMMLTETIRQNPRLNPDLYVKGILVTRFRTTLSTLRGVHQLKQKYGKQVIDQYIRECTRVQQAVEIYRPVLDFDPACNAAKDYHNAFSKLEL